MKFCVLMIAAILSFFNTLHAENMHLHPQANQIARSEQFALPGYCEIEILNHSYDDIRVNGVFDDGVSLVPFNVYSFGRAEYISLYYYGYCHDGMDLYIDTYYGKPVFSGYVSRYTTIRIVPEYYGSKQLKAIVESNLK